MLKKTSKKSKGLTLIEVMIAVAFVALIYEFVVQLFLGGLNGIDIGDRQEEAKMLASNELVRLSSIQNPLYIGLVPLGDDGMKIIAGLQDGSITPESLVTDGTIQLNQRLQVGPLQTGDNTPELQNASNAAIAVYTREDEWEVQDVDPVLVHLWVTVSWNDPTGNTQPDSLYLETQLSY